MPNQSTYAAPRLDLGQALAEFDLSQSKFVGMEVLPMLGVPREAATYTKILRESLTIREEAKRAKRINYNRGTFDSEDDSYECREFGHDMPLDDSERSFFSNDYDAEFCATMIAFNRVMREHENRVAAAVFDSVAWTGATLTTAVGTEWSTVTADVLGDVTAAKEKVRQLTGMTPNALIINQTVWNNIRLNTDLIEQIKHTKTVTDAEIRGIVAAWLGIDRVIVGGGINNTADEGLAFSGADIWDDEFASVAVICNPGDALMTACVGRTFVWEQDTPATSGLVTEEYREEQIRSWIYRVRHNVDEKIHDVSFAHLLSNISA